MRGRQRFTETRTLVRTASHTESLESSVMFAESDTSTDGRIRSTIERRFCDGFRPAAASEQPVVFVRLGLGKGPVRCEEAAE
jgi:hypothetical protein